MPSAYCYCFFLCKDYLRRYFNKSYDLDKLLAIDVLELIQKLECSTFAKQFKFIPCKKFKFNNGMETKLGSEQNKLTFKTNTLFTAECRKSLSITVLFEKNRNILFLRILRKQLVDHGKYKLCK